MKKLVIISLIVTCALGYTACNDDDDNDKSNKFYREWYKANDDWFKENIEKKNPDGSKYYEPITPVFNPSTFILVHWFNDRDETKDNLRPISTSTCDLRYYGHFYNEEPFDSTVTLNEYGPGIARMTLNDMVPGFIEGVTNMHVGDSCEFLIPYSLGYGVDGKMVSNKWVVLPYSALRFNVRLVNIYRYELPPGD